MKTFMQRYYYPLLFIGSAILAHQFSSNPLAGYGILGFAIASAILLEYKMPYSPDWLENKGESKLDFLHFVINAVLNPLVKILAIYAVGYLTKFSFLSLNLRLEQLPIFFSVLLAVLIGGFMPYWIHRWSHEKNNILWRMHSVHHSSERLYWLNGAKFHPFNLFWNSFFSLLPLLILGFSSETLVVVGIINTINSFYSHSNIDFKLGWMNYVFNMSELHRWHHSKNIEEANTNYSAGCLIFWDLIFGTFYLPNKPVNPQNIGLFSESANNYPIRNYWKQLLYPFLKK